MNFFLYAFFYTSSNTRIEPILDEQHLSITSQKIANEYAAIAFSDLFDIVRPVDGCSELKLRETISAEAMRAVAVLQCQQIEGRTKLVIRMHDKLRALKNLEQCLAQSFSTGNITADRLMQLTPERLAQLVTELQEFK